jgi:hypothetical protein
MPAAPSPASRNTSVAKKSPGLAVEYNHDLNVAGEFLASYSSIRDALRDERLWQEFQALDNEAEAHKRSFERLGLLALVLGLLPLVTAALRMMIGEPVFAGLWGLVLAAEFAGVLSVALVIRNRLRRYRVLWCQAAFCRERLRQWHFQKFLDGELIGSLIARRAEFDRELDRRWGVLQQNLRDGYGMMTEFLHDGAESGDLFPEHKFTPYQDQALAKLVCDALWTLRFEHQLRYSRRKIEPTGEQAGLALEERTTWSESVASATLAGAVVVSALAFFFSLSHLLLWAPHAPSPNAAAPWQELHVVATRFLGGLALLLAVLSAGSRAYRAGFTLPDELESYDEYCDRIRELKAAFTSVATDEHRLRVLKRLEEESASELRRLLRMKMRATFVS